MTDPDREALGPPPPSLTPPPRTVTLPPSYGVTAGVGFALGMTPGAIGVFWRTETGEGSRPRECTPVPFVGVLSSSAATRILAAVVNGSAEPGLEAGVRSWVCPEFESEIVDEMDDELPLLCLWPDRAG